MSGVIYKITNLENAKFYVGSTIDLHARWRKHKRELNAGKHHCPHLQAAWAKYGPDAFVLRVVEHVEDSAMLMVVEQRWLDEGHASGRCYNYAKYVDNSNRGVKFQDSHRRAISEALKARYRAHGVPNVGRKHTPESIEKMKAAHAGKAKTEVHRQRLREANLGKKASPETRALLSQQRKGRVKSETHVAQYNKAVLEVASGEVFPSLKAVKERFGIHPGVLNKSLSLDAPLKKGKHAGLHFRYAA